MPAWRTIVTSLISKFFRKCHFRLFKTAGISSRIGRGEILYDGFAMALLEDVMHRMNFSQAGIPQKDNHTANPLLLFLASGVCAAWLVETLLAQFGM